MCNIFQYVVDVIVFCICTFQLLEFLICMHYYLLQSLIKKMCSCNYEICIVYIVNELRSNQLGLILEFNEFAPLSQLAHHPYILSIYKNLMLSIYLNRLFRVSVEIQPIQEFIIKQPFSQVDYTKRQLRSEVASDFFNLL